MENDAAADLTSPKCAMSDQKETSTRDAGSPPTKRPGSKAQGRKRTKTGCLTCRKRRIKCGEERPVCQNCTKSKRQCEGYNQRVVFKDPLNAYRPSLSTTSHMAFSGSISSPLGSRQSESFSHSTSGQKATPIAPKPSGTFRPSSSSFDSKSIPPPGSSRAGPGHRIHSFSDGVISTQDQSQITTGLQTPGTAWRKGIAANENSTHYDFATLTQTDVKRAPVSPTLVSPLIWSDRSRRQSKASVPTTTHDFRRKGSAPLDLCHSSLDSAPSPSFDSTFYNDSLRHSPKNTTGPVELPLDSTGNTGIFELGPGSRERSSTCHSDLTKAETYTPQRTWDMSQPWPLDQHQFKTMEEEEDPFDVSDDDVEMMETNESGVWQEAAPDDHLKNNDLGIVVALQASQDSHGVSLRSFTSFIDRPDMLATYVPSSQSTPLRDPMTARIFCHFVNVTGPCISMFERHPANPSLIFRGEPVPMTQHHIWTYTFPTLALQNPGLLHAMLAIASLHIAKLQNGPITASYKHYALSLRRVAKSVSLPSRRGHPATLAAALLLAFYECWSADHQKWSNHLLGARQLVREIGFAQMTRYIKRKAFKDQDQPEPPGHYFEETRFRPHIIEVDENIVGMLMGDQVRYDQYGQIIDDATSGVDDDKEYTERDLEIYETQRDLFWWYCKQDTYQSILGGGRLFMDYSLWSHCPPRAPLGRLDAVYGTFDHLILLMGRLANFSAKDLRRKRLAIKMNGGRWQPPESTRTPPQAHQSVPMQTSPQTPGAPPILAFSGMVPNVQEATLPMGFASSPDSSPQSSAYSEDADLQTQTQEAEEEWQDIRNAFAMLEDHFGENFQALGPEYSAPIQTPFGPALQYRTFGIAGVWMNYYMGLISCYRAHPSMPPAAMMAAGISAQQTGYFANELGRIAAGVAPDCSMTTHVNPAIGAALIESCQPLFVSAVQYQNAEQRSWTICRLRDIARLTGWQSALAIASGCETTWVRTGELGKGPPYTRTKEERVVPDIWASSRRIDRAFDGKTSEERRLVIERSDRVHYAMGVLSLEEDFEKLDLDTSHGS